MADNVLPFRRKTDPVPASEQATASPDVPASQAEREAPRAAEPTVGWAQPAPMRPLPSQQPERLWREALGEQLRERRTDRGERISDVAQRAGVSPQYLSEIERGRKDPSSEVLAAVSGALGLSVQELARTVSLRLAGGAIGPVCVAA